MVLLPPLRLQLALALVVITCLTATHIRFVGSVAGPAPATAAGIVVAAGAALRSPQGEPSLPSPQLKQARQHGEGDATEAAAQPLLPSDPATAAVSESVPAPPSLPSPHPLTVGPNPHRDFCQLLENGTSPARPLSPFNAIISDELRQVATEAALDASDAKAQARLKTLLQPYEDAAKCYWATYVVPDGTREGVLPICTHDPEEDTVISKPIHTKYAWWDPFVYAMFHNRLRDGECPPDRPVVLDIGVNIGSFALYALKRGCHVIGIDALSMNVNRVVQTVVRAVGEDGKPYISRFHAFRNAVGSQLGKEADSVILEDLLFNLPESERPLIRVGTRDPVSGEWVYALTPLQPHHVYMVKADVEGFEVPALFGMRRLFEGAIRPSAISMEFSLFGNDGQSCEYGEFVRFMYTAGYRFLPESSEGLPAYTQEKFEAELHYRMTCEACHKVFEGWWVLER